MFDASGMKRLSPRTMRAVRLLADFRVGWGECMIATGYFRTTSTATALVASSGRDGPG